jgi:hypothetical protein
MAQNSPVALSWHRQWWHNWNVAGGVVVVAKRVVTAVEGDS